MAKFIEIDTEREIVGIRYHGKDFEVLDLLVDDLDEVQDDIKKLKESKNEFLGINKSKDLILKFIPNFPMAELRVGEIGSVCDGIKMALQSRKKKG